MARQCNWKMETEEEFDATRWLDRTLIRHVPPMRPHAPPLAPCSATKGPQRRRCGAARLGVGCAGMHDCMIARPDQRPLVQ